MKYNPEIHHRRSMRLKGYDYSRAGAYFVTICTHDRECLFGEIVNGEMQENDYGRIVTAEWLRSTIIRAEIELGEFVTMPNHFHGIIHIVDDLRGDRPVAPTPATPNPAIVPGPQEKSIGAMMAGFKSAATKRINEFRQSPGAPMWQRNYYEHIIRDEEDYLRIAEYIGTNPQRWIEDKLHPMNQPPKPTPVGVTGRSPLRGMPRREGDNE